jgi:hypothetical protein
VSDLSGCYHYDEDDEDNIPEPEDDGTFTEKERTFIHPTKGPIVVDSFEKASEVYTYLTIKKKGEIFRKYIDPMSKFYFMLAKEYIE